MPRRQRFRAALRIQATLDEPGSHESYCRSACLIKYCTSEAIGATRTCSHADSGQIALLLAFQYISVLPKFPRASCGMRIRMNRGHREVACEKNGDHARRKSGRRRQDGKRRQLLDRGLVPRRFALLFFGTFWCCPEFARALF